MIPKKNKVKTGVLQSNKYPKKDNMHHSIHRYCVLFKKALMPERKYMSHSAEDFTDVRTNQFIKYGMLGPVRIRYDAVKQHNKSEKKWKKEIKALKEQNKMIYSISKKSGSRREIKKIRNIRKNLLRRAATLPWMIWTPIRL